MISHSLILVHLYSHKTVIHALVKDSEDWISHLDFVHCPLSKIKVQYNFLGPLFLLLSDIETPTQLVPTGRAVLILSVSYVRPK